MQYEFPLFEHHCPSWGEFTHLAKRMVIPKGSLILDMNVPAKGIFYVRKGQIDTVLCTLDGPEKVLYSIGEGSLFGQACCFSSGENGETTVWARTDCVLYHFTKETVEGTIAKDHPRLLLEMISLLGHIVRMHGVWHKDSLSLDYFERVCRILVYYIRWKRENPFQALQTGKGFIISADLTQNDVARLLGVHRVTVAKAVGRLKDMGIILNFTKKELHIIDFKRLCIEAQFEERPVMEALAI